MDNVKQETGSNRAFMDVVGDFSDFGFKFSAAHEQGVHTGLPFSSSRPSVVLISDPQVMQSKLPYTFACLYEGAPDASYLYLAVKSDLLSKHQFDEISRLGGVLHLPKDASVAYGFIPLKVAEEGRKRPHGPQYEKDIMSILSTLSKLSLPTVPYPCNSNSMSVIPMFGDHAFEKISDQVAAPVLSRYFGNSVNVLQMKPALQELVEQQTMLRTGISQTREQEPEQRRMAVRA